MTARPSMAPGLWIFLRLFIPMGPILIQYLLWVLGQYDPPFPQPTYIVLLFVLGLVTATEYQSLSAILYGSVAPALAATVLYTVYLMKINQPAEHERALLIGFALWLSLVFLNLARVLFFDAARPGEPKAG